MKSARRQFARGFSLLEVILAIAILAGALTVLGEFARQGIECSRLARETSLALLRCESKMNEITSGELYPEQIESEPWDDPNDPNASAWLFSEDYANTDVQGLIAVTVRVYQNLPPEMRPAECSLVRWIVDPGVELYAPEDESQTDSTQSNTTTKPGSE